MQGFPPCCGGGLLHDLLRITTPPPQLCEHSVQMLHLVNLPSTGQGNSLHHIICEVFPIQFSPPCAGVGELQNLILSLLPPPQLLEQPDHKPQFPKPPLTGQGDVLQVSDSSKESEQFCPPYCGNGFVHVLFLDFNPPPHETEQTLHIFHSLKPPSIGQGILLQILVSSNKPVQLSPSY